MDRAKQSSANAVHQHVYQFTISMIDTGSQPKELSSGILVQVGGRCFVATAKHCVPRCPERRLWILPGEPLSYSQGMLGFLRVERHPDFDLALLELENESVSKYLPNHKPCELDDISCLGTGRAADDITVCGSPGQFVNGDGTENKPVHVQNFAFSTPPFSQATFPAVPPSDRPADREVDIFFYYPEEATCFEDWHTIQLTTPEGFSGGGIWDQGFGPNKVWTTKDIKLIGVQSAWNSTERYARGTQIVHWLKLLWNRIPECRFEIEHAFPAESFEPFAYADS